MLRASTPTASARIANASPKACACLLILVSGLALGLVAGSEPAAAQTQTAVAQTTAPFNAGKRTADDHPNLEGNWDADFLTPLERPDGVDALILAPDKASALIAKLIERPKGPYDPDLDAAMSNKLLTMNGVMRSSWVVEPADGRLPYTPLAKAVLEAAGKGFKADYDNPEERPGSERCVASMGHPPLQAISPVIPSEIVQTQAAIVIWTEDTDGARIIHLTGDPPPDVIRTRAGYSAGHWEGETLVVETTHLAALDPGGGLLRDAIVLGRGSRIVERFSLQPDGALLYQFTVLDADLYDKPWLAEYLLWRNTDHVFEYACHEGNRGMTNILKAARVDRQTPPAPDKADKSNIASGKLDQPAPAKQSAAPKPN